MDIIQYSGSPLSKYLIFAAILIFVFELLRFVLRFINNRNKIVIKLKQYFPAIEIIAILSYLVIKLPDSLSINPFTNFIITIMILILLLIIFWYAIRDIITGLILKSNDIIKVGNKVIIDNEEGKIDKLTYRNLKLIKENEISVFIPYSKIINSKITSLGEEEYKTFYSFELEVNNDKNFKDLKMELIKYVMNLPWSAIDKFPEINLKSETTDKYIISIEGYSVDKSFNENIESELKSKFKIN